jgi:parallel beta-helix repeat protein
VKIKTHHKKILSLMLLFVLMGTSVVLQFNLVGNFNSNKKSREDLPKTSTNHPCIVIDGIGDFADQALVEGWDGNGSLEHPFIIKDYTINASSATGIEIRNSDVYFIIENVTVTDGRDTDKYGFYLNNVTNGRLKNNTAVNTCQGFTLLDSNSNIVTENIAINNKYNDFVSYFQNNGFFLYNSANNTLSSNTATNNGEGFSIWNSSNNTLSSNTATNNREGFSLWNSSSGNILSKNAAINNEGYGFSLMDSSNNTLSKNTSEKTNYGICLTSSSNNILVDNTALDNDYGIALYNSNYNWISGNVLIGNLFGVYEVYCTGNVFENNHINNRFDTLIYIILSISLVGVLIGGTFGIFKYIKHRKNVEVIQKKNLKKDMKREKKLKREVLKRERLEQRRVEKERMQRELQEKELEKQRMMKELREKERLEKERLEQQRLEIKRKKISTIKKIVLELGTKFGRVQVVEIAEECGEDKDLIIKTVKDMIEGNEIHAKYFESSKSIAFDQQANIDELDKLMDQYKKWEEEEFEKR